MLERQNISVIRRRRPVVVLCRFWVILWRQSWMHDSNMCSAVHRPITTVSSEIPIIEVWEDAGRPADTSHFVQMCAWPSPSGINCSVKRWASLTQRLLFSERPSQFLQSLKDRHLCKKKKEKRKSFQLSPAVNENIPQRCAAFSFEGCTFPKKKAQTFTGSHTKPSAAASVGAAEEPACSRS